MPVKLHTQGGESEGDEARIEIVPLIDIMFFLLASFMLVSLSMTQLHRVPLDLPAAATGVADPRQPRVHLAVDRHGVFTWDGAVVTPGEITARLRDMAKDDPRVLIAADAEALHKQVLAVLDAVRAAGVEKVSFESKPAQP
jgi:biopolymer transport protein ExbD